MMCYGFARNRLIRKAAYRNLADAFDLLPLRNLTGEKVVRPVTGGYQYLQIKGKPYGFVAIASQLAPGDLVPFINEFYHSPQWTRVRNYVVARDLFIDQVTGKVISNNEAIVDHIIPRRLFKTRQEQLDHRNLWTLSRGTHTIKTKIEESISHQPNGDNKLRHLSKNWWIKVIKERINSKGE